MRVCLSCNVEYKEKRSFAIIAGPPCHERRSPGKSKSHGEEGGRGARSKIDLP